MKVNKWETIDVSMNKKELLKVLGFEGWEVVTLYPRFSGFDTDGISLTIRKKKEDVK